jgi:hypothetical protein
MTTNNPELNTPEQVEVAQTEQTAPPEPASNIYLGADGGYHDDTAENRERFPAQADVDAQQLDDAAAQLGGEPVPFTEDGEVDGEALAESTITPAGDAADAGSGTVGGASPEGSEVLSGEDTPAKTTAKTRKQ